MSRASGISKSTVTVQQDSSRGHPSTAGSTSSLSLATRRSILAKANMLILHYVAVINQLALTNNLLTEMRKHELISAIRDIKSDFLNLTTIERKVFSICDYARSLKLFEIPNDAVSLLSRGRMDCLFNLPVRSSNEDANSSLTYIEQELKRYEVLFINEGLTFSSRLIDKHEIREKQGNYKILIHRALSDYHHLLEELNAINGYFFGINNKKYMKTLTEPHAELANQMLKVVPAKTSLLSRRIPPPKHDPTRQAKSSPAIIKVASPEARSISHVSMTASQSRVGISLVPSVTISEGGVIKGPATAGLEGEMTSRSRCSEHNVFSNKTMPGVKVLGNSMNWYKRERRSRNNVSGEGEGSSYTTNAHPDLLSKYPAKLYRVDTRTTTAASHGNETSAPTLPTSITDDMTLTSTANFIKSSSSPATARATAANSLSDAAPTSPVTRCRYSKKKTQAA